MKQALLKTDESLLQRLIECMEKRPMPEKEVSPALLRSRVTRFLSFVALSAALAFANDSWGQVSSASHAKPNPCGSTITKCGCVITAPGLYELTSSPKNTTSLNSDQSCIEIAASGVTLVLEGNNLANPAPQNGIGIHLTSRATSSFVSGAPCIGQPPTCPSLNTSNSQVTGWNIGIQEDADSVNLTNLATLNNNCEGVLVNQASNVSVTNFASDSNGLAGVWLFGAAFSQVSSNYPLQEVNSSGGVEATSPPPGAQSNTLAGVLITGTRPTGLPAVCVPSKVPSKASRNNVVSNTTVLNNSGVGIEVQTQVRNSVISGNTSTGNSGGDLLDNNAFCGSDTWFNNTTDLGQESPCVP
jgi:hypothetical protein